VKTVTVPGICHRTRRPIALESLSGYTLLEQKGANACSGLGGFSNDSTRAGSSYSMRGSGRYRGTLRSRTNRRVCPPGAPLPTAGRPLSAAVTLMARDRKDFPPFPGTALQCHSLTCPVAQLSRHGRLGGQAPLGGTRPCRGPLSERDSAEEHDCSRIHAPSSTFCTLRASSSRAASRPHVHCPATPRG
jgi:hypothetical protein